MTQRSRVVADALSTALLAGHWNRAAMRSRAKAALGTSRAPTWLDLLVDEVLVAYRDPPADRPRELADFLPTCRAWHKAWANRRVPRIVEWAPVPTTLTTRPWPVTELPNLAALARLLDLDQGELAWFADTRSLERRASQPLRHYRWTALPRRDGFRLVAAPKSRLKEIQRRLLRHVLEPIPTHDAAHGCVRGRSVRTAVLPHAGSTAVIRADLQRFFPSIRAGRVWSLLRTAGLPEAVAHTITGLVTTVVPIEVLASLPVGSGWPDPNALLSAPHLPIGAPTSPALANLVAFALDRRLTGLAQRFGARYTRYVDDLTFSGGPSLRTSRSRFVALLDTIVRSEGFLLNEGKSVVLGDAGRQSVLGAVINDRPTLARPERDALRALLHNCAAHGWRSQVRGQGDFRAHVLGRVSWATSLDPVFGVRLRRVYDGIDWS